MVSGCRSKLYVVSPGPSTTILPTAVEAAGGNCLLNNLKRDAGQYHSFSGSGFMNSVLKSSKQAAVGQYHISIH